MIQIKILLNHAIPTFSNCTIEESDSEYFSVEISESLMKLLQTQLEHAIHTFSNFTSEDSEELEDNFPFEFSLDILR